MSLAAILGPGQLRAPVATAALAARLVEIVPPKAFGAVELIEPTCAGLMNSELKLIERAARGRMFEFAAGRRAARKAMYELCANAPPILKGSHGEPVWPLGIVGSISHTASVAVAIVGRADEYESLGVDLEDCGPLERQMWPSIATVNELKQLDLAAGRSLVEAGGMARNIFVAKECVYKWQFPLTGAFLEFQDVEVHFSVSAPDNFAARLVGGPRPAEMTECRGRVFRVGDWTVASIASVARAEVAAHEQSTSGTSSIETMAAPS